VVNGATSTAEARGSIPARGKPINIVEEVCTRENVAGGAHVRASLTGKFCSGLTPSSILHCPLMVAVSEKQVFKTWDRNIFPFVRSLLCTKLIEALILADHGQGREFTAGVTVTSRQQRAEA
jgi:hypothetical protein